MNKEVPERSGESKEPSERSTEEPPAEQEEWDEARARGLAETRRWIDAELAAGRQPGLIQDEVGKEPEDADP